MDAVFICHYLLHRRCNNGMGIGNVDHISKGDDKVTDKELEQKWREEFQEWLHWVDPMNKDFETAYLAACQKRTQEAREKNKAALEALERILNGLSGDVQWVFVSELEIIKASLEGR